MDCFLKQSAQVLPLISHQINSFKHSFTILQGNDTGDKNKTMKHYELGLSVSTFVNLGFLIHPFRGHSYNSKDPPVNCIIMIL